MTIQNTHLAPHRILGTWLRSYVGWIWWTEWMGNFFLHFICSSFGEVRVISVWWCVWSAQEAAGADPSSALPKKQTATLWPQGPRCPSYTALQCGANTTNTANREECRIKLAKLEDVFTSWAWVNKVWAQYTLLKIFLTLATNVENCKEMKGKEEM